MINISKWGSFNIPGRLRQQCWQVSQILRMWCQSTMSELERRQVTMLQDAEPTLFQTFKRRLDPNEFLSGSWNDLMSIVKVAPQNWKVVTVHEDACRLNAITDLDPLLDCSMFSIFGIKSVCHHPPYWCSFHKREVHTFESMHKVKWVCASQRLVGEKPPSFLQGLCRGLEDFLRHFDLPLDIQDTLVDSQGSKSIPIASTGFTPSTHSK